MPVTPSDGLTAQASAGTSPPAQPRDPSQLAETLGVAEQILHIAVTLCEENGGLYGGSCETLIRPQAVDFRELRRIERRLAIRK